MSMNPDDPFTNPQQNPTFGQSAPPRQRGKGCLLACLGVTLVSMLACCGGGVFVMYAGFNFLGSEFEQQLATNPDIEEHLGEIESFEFSFSGTIEEARRNEGQGGETALVFDVQGSTGSGRVLVVQGGNNRDGPGIQSAVLVMPDGTRHSIDVEADLRDDNLTPDSDELDEMFDAGEIQNDAGGIQNNDGGIQNNDEP